MTCGALAHRTSKKEELIAWQENLPFPDSDNWIALAFFICHIHNGVMRFLSFLCTVLPESFKNAWESLRELGIGLYKNIVFHHHPNFHSLKDEIMENVLDFLKYNASFLLDGIH